MPRASTMSIGTGWRGNEGVDITLGIDVGKRDLWPVCRWQTGRFERPGG